MSGTLRNQCPEQHHMAHTFCPDVPVKFLFDFAALGNLIWTIEQGGDDVQMKQTTKKVFFITLESMWICPLPAAGECRSVYLTLLWFEDLI